MINIADLLLENNTASERPNNDNPIVDYSDNHEKIDNAYNEILVTIKTNEQMSLKSIIWNDNIPISDRLSACDIYIKKGYNSVTKKHCEIALANYEK